jgi:hypothetical protein
MIWGVTVVIAVKNDIAENAAKLLVMQRPILHATHVSFFLNQPLRSGYSPQRGREQYHDQHKLPPLEDVA